MENKIKDWEGKKEKSKGEQFNLSEEQKENQESNKQNLIKKFRKKSLFRFKLATLLLLSFLVGVLIKVEAKNYITIGAEDYKLKKYQSDFKLSSQNKQEEADLKKVEEKDQTDEKVKKEIENSEENQIEEEIKEEEKGENTN